MIAFVEGVLVRGGTDAVVAVAGGGVGLDVLLSSRGAERLPAVGDPVRLWTHLAVREDAWTLYGFSEADERAMFRMLISVTGIGPKVALSMLSGAAAVDIARFLQRGDEAALSRLPGIGKKSAARLVVELGQRVPAAMAGGAEEGLVTAHAAGEALGEAAAVLASLGLAPVEAEALLREARAHAPAVAEEIETWVKAALARLAQSRGR